MDDYSCAQSCAQGCVILVILLVPLAFVGGKVLAFIFVILKSKAGLLALDMWRRSRQKRREEKERDEQDL